MAEDSVRPPTPFFPNSSTLEAGKDIQARLFLIPSIFLGLTTIESIEFVVMVPFPRL